MIYYVIICLALGISAVLVMRDDFLDTTEVFKSLNKEDLLYDDDKDWKTYIQQCNAELLEWDMWMSCHMQGCNQCDGAQPDHSTHSYQRD